MTAFTFLQPSWMESEDAIPDAEKAGMRLATSGVIRSIELNEEM